MSLPGRACVACLCTLAAVAGGLLDPRLAARQSGAPTERPPGPTIEFLALQADGTPVLDLQASDVEIRVNDKVRTVRSLRRVTAGPPPMAAGATPRLPAPYGTNGEVIAGRRFVLIVDQESFVTGREPLLRRAVDGLLTQLTPQDRTMIAALPFGGIATPFTSDPARIRSAIGAVSGQGVRTESGSDMACRTRRFLESLESFLAGEGGRDAPLTVVIFTAGLAGPRRDAPMGVAPGMCELLVDDFKRITVATSAARANVYVLQPDDVGMNPGAWRDTIKDYKGSDNPLEGIEQLAGAAGGPRLPLDAAGTGALLRVARESSSYYAAELAPERDEVFGRARALSVRVSRAGVTVRSRPSIAFTDPARRPGAPRLAISDLLASQDPFTELPLRAAGFTMRDGDGRLRVGVVVEPVDPAVSFASVGAILVGGDGRVVARWFGKDAAERPLLGAMAAPPGTYRLRVAAVDTDGRAGAAEEVVEAGLTPVGPLSLGSVMLGVSRNDAMQPQLEFGSEPTAIASFDIYGGAAGQRLSATLEVARTPEAPPILTLPLALTRADEGRVVATGAVPIGALPPGDYVVRGTIRLEDGTTGRVVRTLRKVAR